jgi:hypothetical protein
MRELGAEGARPLETPERIAIAVRSPDAGSGEPTA